MSSSKKINHLIQKTKALQNFVMQLYRDVEEIPVPARALGLQLQEDIDLAVESVNESLHEKPSSEKPMRYFVGCINIKFKNRANYVLQNIYLESTTYPSIATLHKMAQDYYPKEEVLVVFTNSMMELSEQDFADHVVQ